MIVLPPVVIYHSYSNLPHDGISLSDIVAANENCTCSFLPFALLRGQNATDALPHMTWIPDGDDGLEAALRCWVYQSPMVALNFVVPVTIMASFLLSLGLPTVFIAYFLGLVIAGYLTPLLS
jgi:hypothetical protein